MCLGCSDGSPSSRLVRLKLKFQKPRLRSGLFCAQITGKILKDLKKENFKRDRLSNLDIMQIVCILYIDEDATYESRRV